MRIRLWLQDLGLPQYTDAFETNHVDEELLPLVNDQVLKDIGVASAGHRLRILASIANLSAHRQDAPRAAVGDLPARGDDGERRQATVLFVDISGYTTLCSQTDPEPVQALLNRFYEVADGIIVGYGGYVVDHAGDGIFAAFGAPVAHDNDAERSVRAALDIHRKASAINDPTGQPLTLHAGIASGEVVAATIAGGARPKYSVTGDAVNLAARLGSMARSGQTLIADTTWRPVSRHFDAKPLGETQVKGINRPVLLWSLIGPRRTAAERRPFVGRHTEMRQLMGVLDAVKDGQGQSICVRGEAGIGKSRLVEHFLNEAQLHGFECHTGSVLDFGVGKRQDALAAIIEDVLGLGIQANEAAVQAAVQTAVSTGLITADQHVLINDVLDLAQTTEQRAAFDAMDNQTRMQRVGETFAGLIQRAALLRPQVILVEDIHWASADLLRHLALLAHAASESRIVLLMTSRFESYPLDRAWRASSRGSALMTVDLGPLRSHECRLLAAGLVQSSEGVLAECIARADGNPLFLEQLLRNAAETQASNLPASIQSLVLARLDRLGTQHKMALQAASVIGKRFAVDALQALLNEPTYACAPLIDADMVRPEGPDYVFTHALIQEGIYSSLLGPRKRELHRRAADWFGDQEPILRAEHLDRASDPTAAQAYLVAARSQARRFRHDSALRLANRGVEIADLETLRCSLLLLRGDLLRESGKAEESLASFQSALQHACNDDQRSHAWMGLVAAYRVTSHIPEAMAALDEAQPIAQRLGDSALLSRMHHVRGNLHFAAGDIDACVHEHKAALSNALQAKDAECEAQALSGLGYAAYSQGRMLSGLDHFTRCVELSERAALVKVEIANRCMAGHCLFYANRMDEADAAVRLALEHARRIGLAQAEIFAIQSVGVLLAWKGEYAPAAQALADGISRARAAGARRYLTSMLCALAETRLAAEAPNEARALLDEALTLARESGMAMAGAWIWSVTARAETDVDQAKRTLAKGEEALHGPSLSHCRLHFYRNAIDVSLWRRDWSEAARYAAMLEQYVREEPLPWALLLINRARTLAAIGAGECSEVLLARLRQIQEEITRVGIKSAQRGMSAALAQAGARS